MIKFLMGFCTGAMFGYGIACFMAIAQMADENKTESSTAATAGGSRKGEN